MVSSIRNLFAFAAAAAAVPAIALPAAAGPISVFTQVYQTNGTGGDEIHFGGLGTFGVLTTGGGVDPVITVPSDQNGGSQSVVGFWPVIGFSDHTQYAAQKDAVVTVPDTAVRLYAEVWNGPYGGNSSQMQKVFIDTTVSARVSATPGQNSVTWQVPTTPTEVRFGDTVISLSYVPVQMPDRTPHIQFDDNSPPMGYPGPIYYPTLLEAHVDVIRGDDPAPGDPPGGGGSTGGGGSSAGGDVSGAPEPATAVLLTGFAAGGWIVRRRLAGRRVVA
jgi:hypothetical protein